MNSVDIAKIISEGAIMTIEFLDLKADMTVVDKEDRIVGIITAFIPMLMDTGGNAGSQSFTLIIKD